jgi:hypothetical protein
LLLLLLLLFFPLQGIYGFRGAKTSLLAQVDYTAPTNL